MNKEITKYINECQEVKLGIQTRCGIYWFNRKFSKIEDLEKFLKGNNHELSDPVLTFIRENNLFKGYVIGPVAIHKYGIDLENEKLLTYYEYYFLKVGEKRVDELIKFYKFDLNRFRIYNNKISKTALKQKERHEISHNEFKKKWGCTKADFDNVNNVRLENAK